MATDGTRLPGSNVCQVGALHGLLDGAILDKGVLMHRLHCHGGGTVEGCTLYRVMMCAASNTNPGRPFAVTCGVQVYVLPVCVLWLVRHSEFACLLI